MCRDIEARDKLVKVGELLLDLTAECVRMSKQVVTLTDLVINLQNRVNRLEGRNATIGNTTIGTKLM